jgi:hypothetical protein
MNKTNRSNKNLNNSITRGYLQTLNQSSNSSRNKLKQIKTDLTTKYNSPSLKLIHINNFDPYSNSNRSAINL